MTNNYFRAGRAVFFFDSREVESIRAAWLSATRQGPSVSVWRPFRTWPEAAWYGVDVIGIPSAKKVLASNRLTGIALRDRLLQERAEVAHEATEQAWAEHQAPFMFR